MEQQDDESAQMEQVADDAVGESRTHGLSTSRSEGGRSSGEEGGSVGDASETGEDQSGTMSVCVEAPAVWHASWNAWQMYLRAYCEQTKQVLPVRETMSRAERNKRLRRTKKGCDESQLVGEQFDPYQRVYICTHGWKKRKSRGEGTRPKQHIRLTDCPFRFLVQWNLSRGELQVKNGVFHHNHQISSAAFATYPTSRGVSDALVGAQVEGMLAVGAKRSKIYDYLLDHDQNVIQVDVDNLVREHTSSVASGDDDDATAREIAAFVALDPENVASVAETNAGETGVISLASAHMRRVYSRFSEVLLVDCSHKTNRYNYQLLTFMAMNEFGEGAVVQQSLIEANGDWHMERAIAHFKVLHPSRIQALRVIVVDKDLNEIRVLESNFPDAQILICHFHVIKYLKEKRAKPEYGKISTADAGQMDSAIHAMVYAKSDADYNSAHAALAGVCSRIGMQGFMAYFDKNWHASQDRWVMHKRAHLPHFKNHTNNRLESFFGKLKDAVNGSMSMAMCVKSLVAFDRRKQNEYQYRLSRIGQFVNTNYDEEMANLLRFTTHFVASQVEEQYARALEKAHSYLFNENPDEASLVVVSGKFAEHRLHLDTWVCDCEFAQSMKLPCRHAIAYRKAMNVKGTLIPWNRIDARWTSSSSELKKVAQFSYEAFTSTLPGTAPTPVRSHAERYRDAVRATHLIASEMADIEDECEFSAMMAFVLNQWRNVRQKKMMEPTQERGKHSGISSHRTMDVADIKKEFDISDSDESVNKSDSKEDQDVKDGSGASAISIRLNPKARKVGAPKKPKKMIIASEKVDRRWFAQVEAGRKIAGEVTLQGLIEALEREAPGLLETQRRLSGVIVRYKDAERKKPKFKKMKAPVLIQDPFYLLPSKLLDACIAVCPVANTEDDAIAVDVSQGDASFKEKQPAKAVEVVQIKDVGTFSRVQIETFKRVENLSSCVHQGLHLHKWMMEEGVPSLPAAYQQIAKDMAVEVLSTYPHKHIDGLPNIADFDFSLLYRAAPPLWQTDASIRALCVRLCNDYPTCKFAGFQYTKTRRTRKDGCPMDIQTRDCVFQQAGEPGTDTVLLPLNFSNAHWCCIIVKVALKRIYYYDPLNQAPYLMAAKAIATHLMISGLNHYDVLSQNNPIQFDAHSCGIFICWMFIRQVVPGPGPDMSGNSLTARRFELFYYLLKGRLLFVKAPEEDMDQDDKEKMYLSAQDEESKDSDEVPPTQLAM